MSLSTITLSSPAAEGAASSSDTSGMDSQKTIQCACGADSIVDIQASNDNGLTWINVYRFNSPGIKNISIFANLMRVSMAKVNYATATVVTISANQISNLLFSSSLTVSQVGANGSYADTSSMSAVKTIYCVGSVGEKVSIEMSNDHSTWTSIGTLTAGAFIQVNCFAQAIRANVITHNFTSNATIVITASKLGTGPNGETGSVTTNVIRYIASAAIGLGDGSSAQNAMLFDDAMDSLPPFWSGQCRFYFQGAGPFLWSRDHTVGVSTGAGEPLTFIGSYTQVATFTVDSVAANVAHATVAPGVDYTGYTLRITSAGSKLGYKYPILKVSGNSISLMLNGAVLPSTFTCEILRPGASIVPSGDSFSLRNLFGCARGASKLAMFGVEILNTNYLFVSYYDMTVYMKGVRHDGASHAGLFFFNSDISTAYPSSITYTIPGMVEPAYGVDNTGLHARRFNNSYLNCSNTSTMSGSYIFTEGSWMLLSNRSSANFTSFVCDTNGGSNNAIWVQGAGCTLVTIGWEAGRITSAGGYGIRVDGGSVAELASIDISSCTSGGILAVGGSRLLMDSVSFAFPTSLVNNTGYGLTLKAGAVAHIKAVGGTPLNGATGATLIGGTAKLWSDNTAAGGSTVNGAHIDAD